jgi:hypothetical protein
MSIRFCCVVSTSMLILAAAPSAHARSIRVDSGNWTQYSSVTESAGGTVNIAGGSANPGIGGGTPVWASTLPSGTTLDEIQNDSGLFDVDPSSSVVYSWTTWSAPYTAGFISCQNPLSNCSGTPIVAQVGVYSLSNDANNQGIFDLSGNPVAGDTEVVFNYSGACPSSAQLSLFGETFAFNPAAGAQCDLIANPSSIYTNDFLFTSTGVEYVDCGCTGSEDGEVELQSGPPPGWSLVAATAVPEPGTLSLLAAALASMIFYARRATLAAARGRRAR